MLHTHAQTVPLRTCKLCLQLPFASVNSYAQQKCPQIRPVLVNSAPQQARSSSSQSDLFDKLGKVCTEMNQAPPSVVSCSQPTDSTAACAWHAYNFKVPKTCLRQGHSNVMCREKSMQLTY